MGRFNTKDLFFMMAMITVMLFTDGVLKAADKDMTAAGSGPVIVIDPGHGGLDTGGVGPGGLREKAVTLALARQIAATLTPGYRVILTRTGDYAVDAADRVALANHNHADLFVSLHVGGGFAPHQGGMTVFVLKSAPAAFQNASPLSPGGVPVDAPCRFWDNAQDNHHRRSLALAEILVRGCHQAQGLSGRVNNEPVAILQGADMPAVMVEIGCLSNSFWEKQFMQPDRLAALSNMISQAISEFFQRSPGAVYQSY